MVDEGFKAKFKLTIVADMAHFFTPGRPQTTAAIGREEFTQYVLL